MKSKFVLVLLTISLGVNLFIFGRWLIFEQWFEATDEEKIVLSEMVQKTVESEDYKRLADSEDVIAINTDINKVKGGVFPYYFNVSVRTDKQTYLFSCSDEECSAMEEYGTTYSIYKDESPRLPFSE
ncbi:hypothetical protein P6709_10145 [Jeotgalibacillus sp. ET6]|uniref:hypothetical protein n=1 Tax=Jeotgalibacillus sp. ET6 TaxID=3037260 RepID=UPI00241830BC|nr:hypothetical protein [Jeotgalibacillus sp. ET6]MDG5472113.1 hypothetical protein [Jeotgalibacillus sp. ET6]